jgi:methyltransferase-like protein
MKMLLAPQGVGYISYNTYPGCHARQMIREMLRFHVRGADSPQEKISQSRQLAQFLMDAQVGDDIDKQYYRRELEKLKGHPDYLLYHDDLADLNTPSYFVQFVSHADQHGLQFLAEADFCEMQDIFYPDAVVESLRKMVAGQVLLKEQYLDFIKCRRFRRTLLCHQEVTLDRDLQAELAQRFLASSSAAPVSGKPDIRGDGEEEFAGRAGGYIRTNQPLLKALLMVLSEAWPSPLSFRESHAKVKTLLGPDEQAASARQDTSPTALENMIMHSFQTGLVQLHVHVPRFIRQPSVRPVASPLARWQVGQGRSAVTNLFHSSVDIAEPVGRRLILLLDGSRDRDQLRRDLVDAVEAGTVPLEFHGEPVSDPRRIREMIDRDLEVSLNSLGRLGLLVQ